MMMQTRTSIIHLLFYTIQFVFLSSHASPHSTLSALPLTSPLCRIFAVSVACPCSQSARATTASPAPLRDASSSGAGPILVTTTISIIDETSQHCPCTWQPKKIARWPLWAKQVPPKTLQAITEMYFSRGWISLMSLEKRYKIEKSMVELFWLTVAIGLFLPRDAMLARYMLWACVCLSVSICLSVTSRRSTKTARRRIALIAPHNVMWRY